MKKIYGSIALLILLIAGLFGVSRAFFSDTETSSGNVLAAGSIDLKVDNTCYYNGQACTDGFWGGQPNDPESPTNTCSCTWESKDLEEGDVFFDLRDLKPGDWEEDTISLTVEDNDAWVCADLEMTDNSDNGFTEPEDAVDGTPGDNADGTADGDLAEELYFIFWNDDGDNVLETGEDIITEGLASEVLGGAQWAIADATTEGGPLAGGTTHYIGKGFCYGDITLTPVAAGDNSPLVDPGFDCDGAPVGNISQTDLLMGNVTFTAVQSRNNTDFVCSGEQPSPTPVTSITPSPTSIACGTADVMLVLDRSGSISSGELTSLKTAADAFVDALGLTTTGVHGGMSSFATTATLNHHLSDSGVSVKAAIDALSAGGFTNLAGGIDLAKVELDNPGDGHDRTDATSPDKMIIITDGNPNRPLPSDTADDAALASAASAKAAGSEIFVVGVGSDVNATFLQSIASGAGNYYSASDYSGLQTALMNLDLCNEAE